MRQEFPLLTAQDLSVCYRNIQVLNDVSVSIWPFQIVAIVGPNGSGKTTLLKSIAGLLRTQKGKILLKGERIDSLSLWDIVRRGLVYVPEGMSVFPDMTVIENLEIGAYLNRSGMDQQMKLVFDLFPEIYEKRNAYAGVLSGGQQRMVTLGRGLMSGAQLLLLDDPFLGLSPKIIKRFCDTFRTLRKNGVTLFIASQHVRRILNVADAAFLIEEGNITLMGSGSAILHDQHLQQILFGHDAEAPVV